MVVGILAALGVLGAVGWILSVAAGAPPLSSIKPRDPGAVSSVYAADGKTRLGFIAGDELRVKVDGKDLPKVLKDATVAIEDERYYSHAGVDFTGLLRGAFKSAVSRGETIQGGSTITMQLVRAVYYSDERTLQRKIREAKLAEELENEHDKEWILDEYLNTVPYGTVGGQTALGAGAAARVYFSKRVEDLKLHEAAMLAGLPQAPSSYGPVHSPDAAMRRRNEVLDKMAEQEMISVEQAEKAKRRNLGIKLGRVGYFSQRRESFFFDYVKDALIEEYGNQRVRRGGLRVDTTLDLKLQKAAKNAINGRLAGIGPSGAIVTIDPRNGYIKAMASSADYRKLKFNLASQGRRQPGSTFKIMALMAAVRKGINPSSTQYTSVSPFKTMDPKYGEIDIKTYSGSSAGTMSLAEATTRSDNSVYIQLALDIGPDEVKRAARDMGIKSKLGGYPAEALGGLTDGVSPLEMATAYATIASGGYRVRPTAITKVTLPSGRTQLPARFKPKRTRAFPDWVTAEVTKILERNMTGGTGRRAQIGCPAAGKTGTTDNNTDAWFVGFTPRLATSTWVGYPDRQVYMNGLYFGRNVDGGTFPAEIWGDYMKVAKRKFCGSFRPATTVPQWTPFSGTYQQRTLRLRKDTGSEQSGAGSEPSAGDEEENRDERRGGGDGDADDNGGGGGGGGGGNQGFDPNAYESPAEGGAAAPG
jgi:penicillin-binding protein 1A